MTAFASAHELAVFLEDETLEDSPRALLLLDLASDLIRDDIHPQTLDLVEDDIITVYDVRHQLLLPQLPVAEVALVESVTMDGVATTIPATEYVVDLAAGSIRFWNSRTNLFASRWPLILRVTYTHGYAPDAIPNSLRTVALRVVARAVYNPTGIRSQSAGTTTIVADTTAGLYLSPNDQRSLDPFRDRRSP